MVKIIIAGTDYKYCVNKSKIYSCNDKKGVFGRGIINSKSDPYKVTRIGLLGEMALAKYLDVPVRFEYLKHGDHFDFKIAGYTIDVKTASRNYGSVLVRCISGSGKFVLNNPCDIYVAAYIVSEEPDDHYAEVELVGWIYSKRFKDMQPVDAIIGRHKNYQIDLGDVSSISSLRRLLNAKQLSQEKSNKKASRPAISSKKRSSTSKR